MLSEIFADISLWQLALVAAVALLASIVGGVAGYGSGALMPLVLVPILGPEPVVPIIALSALFTNGTRTFAFREYVDWRRVRLVLLAAIVPCIVTAYGYTLLTTRGAMLVIGTMLMLTVPLRYAMRRRNLALGDRGLMIGAAGYGTAVGGTVGAGAILLSVLMAAGLQGAAVIATDAAISIVIGIAACRRVRPGRGDGAAHHRLRAADRAGRGAGLVPGAGLRGAHAAARPRRDPRRGGAGRRRFHGGRRFHALEQFQEKCEAVFRFGIAM